MKISDWLDEQQEEDIDVSRAELPSDMLYDEVPDEIVYFKEIKPCGYFCAKDHPFSSVVRFGHWYYCKGQDKKAGIHSSKHKWHLLTKDRDVAIETAMGHIE